MPPKGFIEVEDGEKLMRTFTSEQQRKLNSGQNIEINGEVYQYPTYEHKVKGQSQIRKLYKMEAVEQCMEKTRSARLYAAAAAAGKKKKGAAAASEDLSSTVQRLSLLLDECNELKEDNLTEYTRKYEKFVEMALKILKKKNRDGLDDDILLLDNVNRAVDDYFLEIEQLKKEREEGDLAVQILMQRMAEQSVEFSKNLDASQRELQSLRGEIAKIKTVRESEKEELVGAVEDAKDQIAGLKRAHAELLANPRILYEQNESLRLYIEKLYVARSEFNELRQKLQLCETLNGRHLQNLDQLEGRVNKQIDYIRTISEENKTLRLQLEDRDAEVDQLKKLLQETSRQFEQDLQSKQNDINSMKEQVRESNEQSEAAKAALISAFEDQIKELRLAHAKILKSPDLLLENSESLRQYIEELNIGRANLDALNQQLHEYEAENTSLMQKVSDTGILVQTQINTIEELTSEIRSLKTQLEKKEKAYRHTVAKIRELNSQLTESQSRVTNLSKQFDKKYSELERKFQSEILQIRQANNALLENPAELLKSSTALKEYVQALTVGKDALDRMTEELSMSKRARTEEEQQFKQFLATEAQNCADRIKRQEIEYRKQLDTCTFELNECTAKLKDRETLEQTQLDLEAEIERLRNENLELKLQYEQKIRISEVKIQRLETLNQEKEQEKTQLRETNENLKERLQNSEEEIKELNNQIEESKVCCENVKKCEDEREKEEVQFQQKVQEIRQIVTNTIKDLEEQHSETTRRGEDRITFLGVENDKLRKELRKCQEMVEELKSQLEADVGEFSSEYQRHMRTSAEFRKREEVLIQQLLTLTEILLSRVMFYARLKSRDGKVISKIQEDFEDLMSQYEEIKVSITANNPSIKFANLERIPEPFDA